MWSVKSEFDCLEEEEEFSLSPRSRLYSLEPKGLGTENVESLTSYLVRLSSAHSVSPRRLIRVEFAKHCHPPGRLDHLIRRVSTLNTIDGLGDYARIFVEETTRLTTVQEVQNLTLLHLANLLPRNGQGTLVRNPRWCTTCLQEMLDADGEVVRPLLWLLSLYQTCHRHNEPMTSACPHCGKHQLFISIQPNLAYCSSCGKLLIPPQFQGKPVTNGRSLISTSLTELITPKLAIRDHLNREYFAYSLRKLVNDRADGNQAEFCRQLKLPTWQLKKWLYQGQRPSLPQLLILLERLGQSPLLFFSQASASAQPITQSAESLTYYRSSRPLLDAQARAALSREMEMVINNTLDTRSLAEVAKSVGRTKSCIKYWFPEQAKTIREKHRKATSTVVQTQSDIDRKAVLKAVQDISANGAYPGCRRVNKALRKQGLSLVRSELRATYKQAVTVKENCDEKSKE